MWVVSNVGTFVPTATLASKWETPGFSIHLLRISNWWPILYWGPVLLRHLFHRCMLLQKSHDALCDIAMARHSSGKVGVFLRLPAEWWRPIKSSDVCRVRVLGLRGRRLAAPMSAISKPPSWVWSTDMNQWYHWFRSESTHCDYWDLPWVKGPNVPLLCGGLQQPKIPPPGNSGSHTSANAGLCCVSAWAWGTCLALSKKSRLTVQSYACLLNSIHHLRPGINWEIMHWSNSRYPFAFLVDRHSCLLQGPVN